MKTYKGFLPQPAAEEFQLGEYGYFDGEIWCRLGNINDLTDVELRTEETRSGLFSEMNHAAQLAVEVSATANAGQNSANTSISFSKSNGYLQRANLDHFSRFASIPEVENLLKDLYKENLWNSDYKLIVCVAYATSFLTLISKSANTSVNVNADINAHTLLEGIKVAGQISVRSNDNEVSVLLKNEDGRLHVSAARFVHLTRKIPLVGQVSAKYLGPSKTGQDNDNDPKNLKLALVDELD